MRTKDCPRCDGTGKLPDNPGRELKLKRIDKGITQRDMAGRLGVDFSYLSRLEGGYIGWTRERVKAYKAELAKSHN